MIDTNFDKIQIDNKELSDYAKEITDSSGILVSKSLSNQDTNTNIPAHNNLNVAFEKSQSLAGCINSSSASFGQNIIEFGELMQGLDQSAAIAAGATKPN